MTALLQSRRDRRPFRDEVSAAPFFVMKTGKTQEIPPKSSMFTVLD